MPSNNKNIIGDLRGKFDPHYKLASNVEGIEKRLGVEAVQIHKNLSKSFAMQRKTLVRVLGLEKRVNELELQQAAEEQAKEGIDEILNDLGEEVQQEVGDVGEEIEKEVGEELGKEVGGVATKKKLNVKKTKITGEAFKKGTVLDDDFKSRVLGQDDKGEYLSAEERKARFKGEPFIKPDSLKPVEEEVKSPVGEGLKNILNSIAGTTESIKNLLMGQQKADRDAAADISRQNENEKRDSREKKVETKMFDGVKKIGEKILAPVKSIWQRVWDFIKTILLAKVVGKIMDWLSDPKNKDKVRSIFRFIKDWWPTLLTGFLLFGTGLGSLITGTVSAIAAFTPMLLGLLPKLLAFLASPIGLAVLGTAAVVGGGMWLHNKMKGDEAKKEIDESQTVKLNKGGQVPGRGPNKDTVPAMLTPGEFVMSRDAVDKWGVDTLAGMNAAAGGTNKPTMGRYKTGGKVTDDADDGSYDRDKLIAAAGPSLKIFMDNHNAILDSDPEFFNQNSRLYMDRDGNVPDFGRTVANMSEWAFNESIQMTQENDAIEPEVKEALIKEMMWVRKETLGQKNFKGDLAFHVNKDIPGTAADRLMRRAKADTSSPAAKAGFSVEDRARLMNRHEKRKMNKGGLVQHFNKGGLVQEMKKLQMEHRRIKPGPNGKYSKEDRERKGQLILRITKLRKQIENYKGNDSTPKTPIIPTNKEKKGGGFGLKRMIGGAADIMTGNLFDFDNRSGGGLLRKTANAVGRVVGGTADALTGNKWDFDNLGRPSAKVGNIKPPSVKISPPGSTTKKGGNITTLNMGKTSSPVGIDNTNAPPEIPYFSATIMRSSDKIKTLGIMV